MYTQFNTPYGCMWLQARQGALVSLDFSPPQPESSLSADETPEDLRIVQEGQSQLQEYFAGTRRCFTLPLAPEGTPFMQRVWQELLHVPYGTTTSYSQIAATLNKPGAARAVGLANHRNPLPIFIPCHRIIGKNGTLTGYAGGLPLKRALLQLEGILLA